MNLKFWDKKARMIAAFEKLTVEEAQEIIKKAKKGYTLWRTTTARSSSRTRPRDATAVARGKTRGGIARSGRVGRAAT